MSKFNVAALEVEIKPDRMKARRGREVVGVSRTHLESWEGMPSDPDRVQLTQEELISLRITWSVQG